MAHQKTKSVFLRVGADTHEDLAEQAELEDRSMAKMGEILLKEALGARQLKQARAAHRPIETISRGNVG